MKKIWMSVLVLILITACAAWGDAKYGPVDPAAPYDAIVNGLFHEQQITGSAAGVYSIYVPKTLQPWAAALIILAPDDITAKSFAEGPTGQKWMGAADAHNFAVSFLEAAGGKKWNVSADPAGRDDAEFIRQTYSNIRNISNTNDAAFTADKYSISVIGYASGGVAAQLTAAIHPAMFNCLVTVDSGPVDAELLNARGAQFCFPWPGMDWSGREEMRLPAREVPMPLWMIRTTPQAADNADAIAYWVDVNKAEVSQKNQYADTYDCLDPHVSVWTTAPGESGSVTEDVIWSQFVSKFRRMMGYPGGHMAFTTDFVPNPDGKTGFFVSEEMVDGYLRRWMTFVPQSYNSNSLMPLVIALPGYTATMYSLAQSNRWFDVAAEYGLIVVFGQAYINADLNQRSIPATQWTTAEPVPEGRPDDVDYVKYVLEATKKKYNIDAERVYLTGHSNGSGMSWKIGVEAPELFAAIGPIGSNGQPSGDFPTHLILPAWSFKGEYDSDGGGSLLPGTNNYKAYKVWSKRNGADESKMTVTADSTGRFVHYTFPNSAGVPLYRYTVVDNSPHTYFTEESFMLWTEFFSKFRRAKDGTLFYEGSPVQREPHVGVEKTIRTR